MIIGEAEVQGQVKRAYELALVEGATGPILNRLFRGALAAGKRARSETGISEQGLSVPSVAVELAQRTLGDLSSRLVLVVGAGETAELTARALAARGVEPAFIANRRYDRAIGLAQRFGGRAVRFEELPAQMEQADIVVASTSSPHHVIEREALAEVMTAREGRPLLLIDLAVPRDIHPDCRELDGVSLHDMDDLQALVERNASGREAEARRAETVLRAELARFERWLASQDVVPDRGRAARASRRDRRSRAGRERAAVGGAQRGRPGAHAGDGAGDREPAAPRADPAPEALLGRGRRLRVRQRPPRAVRPRRRSAPLEDAGRARCARCARRAGASARRVERPAEAGNAGKPARARAGAAGRRCAGRRRDRHRQVERRRARRQGALRARGGAGGAGRRGGPGGPLGQGPARRPSRRRSGWSACPAARSPSTPTWARRRRSTRCPRRLASAPRACAGAPSSWRCGRTSSWSSCTATSTPGCASCPRASSTGSCSPPPACAGSGARREIAFGFGLEELTPAAGQGSLALEARRDDPDAAAAAASISDHDALVELTAERAAVATLEATCHTPVGICARLDGDELTMLGFAGLPDGSEWVRDRVTGDPEQPAALGQALAERMLAAGARADPASERRPLA